VNPHALAVAENQGAPASRLFGIARHAAGFLDGGRELLAHGMLSGVSAAKRANEGFHVQVLAIIDGLNNSISAALRLEPGKKSG